MRGAPKKGKPGVIGEKEPLFDPDETTGICAEHKKQLKKVQVAAQPEIRRRRGQEDAAERPRSSGEAMPKA